MSKKNGYTGVLLVNLGTPSSPTPSAIRRYLREFLSDPRVVEWPSWLWQPLLYSLVLTRRPGKLAPRYQHIWQEEGSPLLVHSQRQVDAVGRVLAQRGIPVRVALGMRYGTPSIGDILVQLCAQGCEQLLVVPLYPQYAASTTASVTDAVMAGVARLRNQPALRFIKRFYHDPGYLDAVTQTITRFWEREGRPQRLLMSFHGLPYRQVARGDPYYQDCLNTGRLLCERLKVDTSFASVTFQSRFGAGAWLKPATGAVLKALGARNIQTVDVVCPGFLADCLETLDEVQREYQDIFLATGGGQLRYIPAVNDDKGWIMALTHLIECHLQGWV